MFPRLLKLIFLAAIASSGCTRALTAGPNPAEIDPADYDRYYRAAEQVLEEQSLTLDRQDYRFGIITARPEPLATALEPWRRQHETIVDALRSTVNDERRLTTVFIEKDQPDADHVRVESVIERLQLPTRYLTGSTRGHRIFGVLSQTPSEWKRRGIEAAYWRPIARDEPYERMLMARIIDRAAQHQELPPDLTPPPESETESETESPVDETNAPSPQ